MSITMLQKYYKDTGYLCYCMNYNYHNYVQIANPTSSIYNYYA